MTLTTGGNVGIGTASPAQRLQVQGEAIISSILSVGGAKNAGYDGAFLVQVGADTGTSGVMIRGADGYLSFDNGRAGFGNGRVYYNNTSDFMSLSTAATERMRIDSAGNVGIGTSSPDARLQVAVTRTSGTNTNALILSDNVTGAQTVGFGTRIIGSSNSGNAISAIGFEAGGSGANNDTQIAFYTQSTAGGLTKRLTLGFAGVLALQGGDANTGGIGIAFPATQSASSDANTLDDYEEGTWTPSFTLDSGSATATSASGSYVKIGRQVSVTVFITFSVPSAANVNDITGLPFTVENINQRGVGAVRENGNTGFMWQLRANVNATSANLRRYDNAQALADGMSFIGTLTYFV
jgi:hypothetical protein